MKPNTFFCKSQIVNVFLLESSSSFVYNICLHLLILSLPQTSVANVKVGNVVIIYRVSEIHLIQAEV